MATFNWGIVVLFCLFSNHDFGVILSPFGVRAFVVQMAICGTKTHLANIKNEVDKPPAVLLHSLNAVTQYRLAFEEYNSSEFRHLSTSSLYWSRYSRSTCSTYPEMLAPCSPIFRTIKLSLRWVSFDAYTALRWLRRIG